MMEYEYYYHKGKLKGCPTEFHEDNRINEKLNYAEEKRDITVIVNCKVSKQFIMKLELYKIRFVMIK